MKKYCIDGLIYYHYYFCGDLLLEKPAENLLKWKDIDQPFFFSVGQIIHGIGLGMVQRNY